jgi:hypothetical protein
MNINVVKIAVILSLYKKIEKRYVKYVNKIEKKIDTSRALKILLPNKLKNKTIVK